MGPYRLIVTDNPEQTLGEAADAGNATSHATSHDAATAFANSGAPYRTVIYDDGDARELTDDEQATLEAICDEHDLDLEEIPADM